MATRFKTDEIHSHCNLQHSCACGCIFTKHIHNTERDRPVLNPFPADVVYFFIESHFFNEKWRLFQQWTYGQLTVSYHVLDLCLADSQSHRVIKLLLSPGLTHNHKWSLWNMAPATLPELLTGPEANKKYNKDNGAVCQEEFDLVSVEEDSREAADWFRSIRSNCSMKEGLRLRCQFGLE